MPASLATNMVPRQKIPLAINMVACQKIPLANGATPENSSGDQHGARQKIRLANGASVPRARGVPASPCGVWLFASSVPRARGVPDEATIYRAAYAQCPARAWSARNVCLSYL